MSNGKDFWDRVVRSLRGRNQQWLCEMLGITSGTFSTWKTKGRIPRADAVAKIAELLEVTVEWLVTGESDQMVRETSPVYGEWTPSSYDVHWIANHRGLFENLKFMGRNYPSDLENVETQIEVMIRGRKAEALEKQLAPRDTLASDTEAFTRDVEEMLGQRTHAKNES